MREARAHFAEYESGDALMKAFRGTRAAAQTRPIHTFPAKRDCGSGF
jgi:hypothetical protein